MTSGSCYRRARGLRVFFERDLEDAFLQQQVGDHLLELLVVLLERAQPLRVRARHHPELLLPAAEGRRGDVKLPADLRLAPAGLALPDRQNPGVPRVSILACFLWYRLGVSVGWNPGPVGSTGTCQWTLPGARLSPRWACFKKVSPDSYRFLLLC